VASPPRSAEAPPAHDIRASCIGPDALVLVEHWSIWLGIEILARAPLAVLRGRRAH
jgi:hypothetical protein